MIPPSIQQQVRALIAKGNIEQAINVLLTATAGKDLHEEVLMQSAAFQRLEKESRLGLIDSAEKNLRIGKITYALVQLLDKFAEDDTSVSGPPSSPGASGGDVAPPPPSLLFPALTGLGLLVGIVLLLVFVPCPSGPQFIVFRIALAIGVAGLAAVIPGFFTFQYKQLVTAGGALAVFAFVYLINPAQATSADRCNQPFDFTIFLEDADGKTALKNKGMLTLRLKNDKRSENLDADGSTSFKQLPASAANDTVSVELEAPGWQFANGKTSTRLPLIGNNRTLTIQRDSSLYCCISGSVRDDQNRFLSGVRLSIGDQFVTSDSNGRFALVIPVFRQAEQYDLTATQRDYRTWEATVYPATRQEVKIVLQKDNQ